jgi:hypothetical protein
VKVEKKVEKMAVFRKVIDKLAGGPPNEKVLKERKSWSFLGRHKWGIYVPVGATMIILGGYLIGFVLNPAPKYEDLSDLQGQIISARRTSPEFVVELSNGDKVKMEWPGMYSLVGKEPTSNGPYVDDIQTLKGCQAAIKYAPMRFVLGDHLRIWGLHCRNTGLKFGYKEIENEFKRHMDNSQSSALEFLSVVYILAFFFFLREKRGHL